MSTEQIWTVYWMWHHYCPAPLPTWWWPQMMTWAQVPDTWQVAQCHVSSPDLPPPPAQPVQPTPHLLWCWWSHSPGQCRTVATVLTYPALIWWQHWCQWCPGWWPGQSDTGGALVTLLPAHWSDTSSPAIHLPLSCSCNMVTLLLTFHHSDQVPDSDITHPLTGSGHIQPLRQLSPMLLSCSSCYIAAALTN